MEHVAPTKAKSARKLGYLSKTAPVLDCKQAISIATELNIKIDLVVVNPQLT